jgi:hypothetical protein
MKLRLAGGILAAHLLVFGSPIISISGAEAVYVVDNSASPHIDEYTTAGVFVRTLLGGPANVLFWNGLAFGADSYLYATDTFNCISGNCDNELEQFDTNTGAYLGAVGSINANTMPYSGVTNLAVSLNGLALGPDGNLYVKPTHSASIESILSATRQFQSQPPIVAPTARHSCPTVPPYPWMPVKTP